MNNAENKNIYFQTEPECLPPNVPDDLTKQIEPRTTIFPPGPNRDLWQIKPDDSDGHNFKKFNYFEKKIMILKKI